MKKSIIFLTMTLVLAACGPQDNAKIKEKIIKLKEQQQTTNTKFKEKIAKLEAQLTDSGALVNRIPVEVKEMVGEEFNHYITAYGEVEAEKYAKISPEMGGQIRKLHVIEGQYVQKGDLLVTLNNDALLNTIKQIKTNLEFATQNFEKQQNLWDQQIGSEIQFLQAKNTKESLESQLKSTEAQMRMALIIAPFDGYVDKIYMKEGELASPGFPVLEFVNLKKLSITADISEAYMGTIRKGEPVDVSFETFPDIKLTVPIARVAKVLNSANRSFQIEVKIDNINDKISPFIVSTIKIQDFHAEDAMVVPSLIIKQDISGKYLYLVGEENGKSIATKRYVKIGYSYEDQTLVTKGLKKGDKVILEGFNLVSNGIPVLVK